MSMFKLTVPGSWHLYSKTDSRWNCHGETMVGGFQIPSECYDKVAELKKTLGEPPADLEMGYHKY